MRSQWIVVSLILVLIFLLGCGQIAPLEEVKDTKAKDGPTVFVDPDYDGEASNGTEMFPYKGIQGALERKP